MSINTNLYCEVNTPARDTVLDGPRTLPASWVDHDGNSIKNLNDDSVWNNTQRINIGWYPYVLVDTGGADEYQDRSLSAFNIQATEVTQTANYTPWDIDRTSQAKYQELERQILEYTVNQRAINPKIDEYINDDFEWYEIEQAKIARITDRDLVAAYNTTKPAKLVLPNSYIGASFIRQGYSLTAQNQAATGSGDPEIWDQTIVNSFISQNQAAASDSSNSTSPVPPPYQIRQGISTTSEQFNRVVIYRFDRDDPIPSQQRAYAMQMSNRQDARNLYIFSYTGITYLTWRLFEDQGNGIWYLEATPAERQYTDTDMAFIFSYGTNPAVETDYFTDRVEFPAGVEEQTLLIAWDQQ
ncbi:MAG: hypothetical protein R3250_00065 [Melioribacteraceae bacterium]|nr:hypothetical protein [Melioribacteraceae bacterium]